MKRYFILFTAAFIFCASTAWAQESDVSNSESFVESSQQTVSDDQDGQPLLSEENLPQETASNQVESENVQSVEQDSPTVESHSEDASQPEEYTDVQESAPAPDVVTMTDISESYHSTIDKVSSTTDEIWKSGFDLYLGIGPAFDLRDPAAGYSARVGLDYHGRYLGIGLDVTWNMLWATEPATRADNQDMSYRVTSSGLLLFLNGYIPATRQFIVKLGGGIGVGRRYEIIFSNNDREESGSSWLARVQAGGFYLFENHITLGFDLELNFNNYTYAYERWWSDCEIDVSLGVVLTFSYQFLD